MLTGLFKKFTGKEKSSKDVAKKRLQFALVYDQLEVNEDILKNLQQDIVNVISNYFIIDKDSLHLDIRKSDDLSDDLSALVFNTPILSAKRKK